jgi:hypothetical protein
MKMKTSKTSGAQQTLTNAEKAKIKAAQLQSEADKKKKAEEMAKKR